MTKRQKSENHKKYILFSEAFKSAKMRSRLYQLSFLKLSDPGKGRVLFIVRHEVASQLRPLRHIRCVGSSPTCPGCRSPEACAPSLRSKWRSRIEITFLVKPIISIYIFFMKKNKFFSWKNKVFLRQFW